jgi:hypothetical protein
MSRKKLCFVISPIGDEESDDRGRAEQVMEKLIKPALTVVREKVGIEFEATRSDQLAVVGDIVDDIVDRIIKDEVVIAVLFNRNPNVYYELGIAHSAARPVVLLKNKREAGPFDVTTHRMVEYSWKLLSDPPDERSKVVQELADAIVEASRTSRHACAFKKLDPLGQFSADYRVLNKFKDLDYGEYTSFFDVKHGFIGLMGVSLHHFTRGNPDWVLSTGEHASFAAFMQSKVVVNGCHVTLVIMDENNPALLQMLHSERQRDVEPSELEAVRNEIGEATRRWHHHIANATEKAKEVGSGGSMRLVKVRRGMVYHRLSMTDHSAIATPYFFHIGRSSGGPAIVARADTSLYQAIRKDFQYLVERNAVPVDAGASPTAEVKPALR